MARRRQYGDTWACITCGRVLPLTAEYFYRCAKTARGFLAKCKQCHIAAVQTSTNPERIKRYADHYYAPRSGEPVWGERRAWRQQVDEPAEVAERRRAQRRAYYHKHRAHILAREKAYRAAHPAKFAAFRRRWYRTWKAKKAQAAV